MTCKIDGVAWSANQAVFGLNENIFYLNGANQVTSFSLPFKNTDFVTGRTLTISTNNGLNGCILPSYYNAGAVIMKSYTMISGSLIITNASTNILEGTFSFIAQEGNNTADRITITEGEFSATVSP